MMPEQPTRDECDREVYEHGTVVAVFVMPKDACEALCVGLAATTGCRVDWHYVGGRNVVKVLGDAAADRVRALVREIHGAQGGAYPWEPSR